MFLSHVNEHKAIYACRYSSPYDPADYTAYQTEFVRAVAAARAKRLPMILFVELDDGYPQPNALQRKNIGEAWGRVPDVGGVIAIVTSSAIIRGIITAIEWFMKNSPNRRETRAFARREDAIPWLAEQSGVPAPELSAALDARKPRERVQHAAP